MSKTPAKKKTDDVSVAWRTPKPARPGKGWQDCARPDARLVWSDKKRPAA